MTHLFKMIIFNVSLNSFDNPKLKKNSYSGSRVMIMCHFWVKMTHLPQNEDFFIKTINISFMHFLTPFIAKNFKKIFRVDPELWGHAISRPKMAHLPQMRIFFRKTINIIPMYFLALFTVQKFKMILRLSESYKDEPFLGPKSPICPQMRFSFRQLT